MSTREQARKGGFMEDVSTADLGGGSGCCGGSGGDGGCCGEPSADTASGNAAASCCGEPAATSAEATQPSGCCG